MIQGGLLCSNLGSAEVTVTQSGKMRCKKRCQTHHLCHSRLTVIRSMVRIKMHPKMLRLVFLPKKKKSLISSLSPLTHSLGSEYSLRFGRNVFQVLYFAFYFPNHSVEGASPVLWLGSCEHWKQQQWSSCICERLNLHIFVITDGFVSILVTLKLDLEFVVVVFSNLIIAGPPVWFLC